MEKPIPDLTITKHYLTANGNIKIYFTGVGNNNTFGYVLIEIDDRNKMHYEISLIDSTYFGYAEKVIEIIKEKAKLYLLMVSGTKD